jgi:hypothetical protein
MKGYSEQKEKEERKDTLARILVLLTRNQNDAAKKMLHKYIIESKDYDKDT